MIYCISKEMEISAAHRLSLSYPSKCTQLHGHNWVITVYCMSREKNQDGMVVDFTKIKERIHDYLDHSLLNEKLDFNPTAENIAEWIVGQFPECYKATVRESEKNVAMAVDDEMISGINPACLL